MIKQNLGCIIVEMNGKVRDGVMDVCCHISYYIFGHKEKFFVAPKPPPL
jgi:hypothetical protein